MGGGGALGEPTCNPHAAVCMSGDILAGEVGGGELPTTLSVLVSSLLQDSTLVQAKGLKLSVKRTLLADMDWRRQWHPTPVLFPGKSHGWRSLVGCNPWGREESDTTEWLHFHFSLSRIGEGNGNPFQCSCLGNPRDGGAWWAAVYGVAQSQTRLK